MPTEYPIHNNTRTGKQVDSIYENRLRQFIDAGGQYNDINLPKFYTRHRVDHSTEFIKLTVHEIPDAKSRPLFKDVIGKKPKEDLFEREAHKGDWFGPSWKTFWFKIEFKIPEDWADEEAIWFQWDSSSEALFYSEDGVPLQAFTGGERVDYILPDHYKTIGKTHIIYSEMACNGMFGVGMNSDISPPDPNRMFQLHTADLIVPNLKARQLQIDFLIIGDAAREFQGDSWQKYKARQIATEIVDAFDYKDESSIDKCLEIAAQYLGDDVHSEEVYSKNPLGKIDVYAIGNCHIDTAWLWPFAETRRKIVRSWTTQLNLIDHYPEYQFVASQAQQFKWLKQDHPEIFTKLKDSVKSNRFIPIGGSWVEHDTNIPNGESLVRQFLFGQRFFQNEFQLRANTFWLPDTFGYSSQIPQLARQAGFTNFLTQKLSWNNINQFPNTSFNWIGIDGSQVLVHMPPDDTYTADANFGDVKRSISNHKNLTSDQTGLLCYGKGDGGGGPLPEMLEKLRRCRAISNTVGLLPTVELQTKKHTVDEFFKHLLETSENGKKLPTWIGELYFEFHRGTYTSQALVKKLMRINEVKLHDLEYFATLASLYHPDSYVYPAEDINAIWEDVLLCQFHDVLPGSCIGMVYYDEVHPKLKAALLKSNGLIDVAVSALLGDIETEKKGETQLVLVNSLPWTREGVYKIQQSKLDQLNSVGEKQIVMQKATSKSQYIYAKTDPQSNLLIPVELESSNKDKTIKHPATVKQKSKDEIILENGNYTVRIYRGIITSIFDNFTGFELIDQESEGIQYVILRDTPLNWQAWDTELYSLDVITPLKPDSNPKINENGPLRASVLFEQKISEVSSIKTIISLDAIDVTSSTESSLPPSTLTISSKVHWEESRQFLKLQIPVTPAALTASHETQFGITSRPTHNNTTWDVAKFESVHHKFLDVSNRTHGITVFNDSKYGGGVRGNVIYMSLLRGPREPDPDADKGVHKFKVGIGAHKGPLGVDEVKRGYEFNYDVKPVIVDKKVLTEQENKGKIDSSFGKFVELVPVEGEEETTVILSHLKRLEDDFAKKKLSSVIKPDSVIDTQDSNVVDVDFDSDSSFDSFEHLTIHSSTPKTNDTKTPTTLSAIIRLYESLGGFGSAKLKIKSSPSSDLKLKSVYLVNLLEDELKEVETVKTKEFVEVAVETREFEVVSYKVVYEKI